MSSTGQQFTAGRIPGERIATEVVTADSATFTTTETQVASVTAPLVAGRTYRVTFDGKFAGNETGATTMLVRIRLNNTGGTQLQLRQLGLPLNSSIGFSLHMEAEFTAASTGNQEFIVSGVESGGTPDVHLDAAATAPAFLYVDYIRG